MITIILTEPDLLILLRAVRHLRAAGLPFEQEQQRISLSDYLETKAIEARQAHGLPK